MTSLRLRVVLAIVLAVGLISPAAAHAQEPPPPRDPSVSEPLAEGLAGPLGLAVVNPRTMFVGQSFAGTLTRITRSGTTDVAVVGPRGAVNGVAVARRGVYYTATRSDREGSVVRAELYRRSRGGSTVVADLLEHEQVANPDGDVTYGFTDLSAECAALLPEDLPPANYQGIVDSNPYAVAARGRKVFVADAAANAILRVMPRGAVRTVAVLPPQPLEITADIATSLGLPECTVGEVYLFEPVPTDVEIGRGGRLFITTLPGGPEEPGLPARGAVYRVNPRNGRIVQIADGLVSATDVAIGPRGGVYVTELFADRISRIVRGTRTTVAELPAPAAVEFHRGSLYVTYDVFADGKVARVSLR
jgi:hypothetical protein